ncbi:MAG: ergosterol biosynthesis protein [Piccolia ochrophora]|nr:MAG: ergosterol biosynthesis protein [Piccolia ochrophora]
MPSYLPPGPGLLPYWLLLSATSAFTHTIMTLVSPIASIKMYSSAVGESMKSPLAARLFGIMDTYSSLIRVFAAYQLRDPSLYTLAMCTYVIVLLHFGSEWLVFGTARAKETQFSLTFAGVSLIWMVWCREWYVGGSN